MTKAYGIFSGGLDSMLAALVLKDQELDIELVTFTTPFFGPEKAIESGRQIGLIPRVVDLTGEHLQMMQNPRHDFGRYMNPCIDCHALMFNRAGRIMDQEGGDFLFSGEVLGQRPKSQNRRAMELVAHLSGYAEKILRPLSAKCLPETPVETSGLVDRARLLDLSGRTRKPQMELAEKYGLKSYPSPAGGCLLTDPVFSRRLRELYDLNPSLEAREVEFLKYGRHFRLPQGHKVIVGRNKEDNEALEQLVTSDDVVLKAANVPGPTVVIPDANSRPPDEVLEIAAAMTLAYSDADKDNPQTVNVEGMDELSQMQSSARPKAEFARFMIQ
jgi:tRNA-specific 2-thiouridylase